MHTRPGDACESCLFYDLQRDISAEFPKYSLRWKRDSKRMRLIDWVLRVLTFGRMTSFMQRYASTIGYTVYVPTSWEDMTYTSKIVLLRHERVHMRQRAKYGPILFAFLYLFFPLPFLCAYFRMKFEREAYEETIRAMVELHDGISLWSPMMVQLRDRIIANFTGPSYFWMWPFRKSMERWYAGFVDTLGMHKPSS